MEGAGYHLWHDTIIEFSSFEPAKRMLPNAN